MMPHTIRVVGSVTRCTLALQAGAGISRKTETPKDGRTDGWPDGRTRRPTNHVVHVKNTCAKSAPLGKSPSLPLD